MNTVRSEVTGRCLTKPKDNGPTRDVEPSLLVDPHVHFQKVFSWKGFLDAATRNFAAARISLGLDRTSPGCLILTEIAGMNEFQRVCDGRVDLETIGWSMKATGESCSVQLLSQDGTGLFMVAGRQINSLERLEVLALGTNREFEDGRPLHETIAEADRSAALVVLPWGFGKWLGRRGRIIRNLINERERTFLLGDNGGRPKLSWRPRLLCYGEGQGIPVIPGSDPLPLPGHESRPASCGIVLAGWNGSEQPMEWIRSRLSTASASPPMFGSFTQTTSALRSQIALRLSPSRSIKKPSTTWTS